MRKNGGGHGGKRGGGGQWEIMVECFCLFLSCSKKTEGVGTGGISGGREKITVERC